MSRVSRVAEPIYLDVTVWFILIVLLLLLVVLYSIATRPTKIVLYRRPESQWLDDLRDARFRGPAFESLMAALTEGGPESISLSMTILSRAVLSVEQRSRLSAILRPMLRTKCIDIQRVPRSDHLQDKVVCMLADLEGAGSLLDLIHVLETSGHSGAVYWSIRKLEELGEAAMPAINTLEKVRDSGPAFPFGPQSTISIKKAADKAIHAIHASVVSGNN